jgi:replicative DNA helicase
MKSDSQRNQTSGADRPAVELPPILQPGGLVDQVLNGTKQPDWLSQEQAMVKRRIIADLGSIRNTYLSTGPAAPAEEKTPERRLDLALSMASDGRGGKDALLRYCIAEHESHPVASSLEDRAYWTYRDNRKAYDQILGELIPSDLRENVRDDLAHERFIKGEHPTAAQDWHTYQDRLNTRREETPRGLATGLTSLDTALGGLRGITYLAGGPGIGKTSLALFLALGALKANPDLAVLFYTLDMGKDTIFDRIVCNLSGLDYARLVSPEWTADDQATAFKADQPLKDLLPRLRLVQRNDLYSALGEDEQLTSVPFVLQRRELLLATKAERALIVVDYFQLLDVPTDGSPLDADFQRVRLVQTAHSLSRGGNYPDGDAWLLVSEVRKTDMPHHRLTLADVMGSSRIIYSADSVLLLEPSREQADGSSEIPVTLRIAKGRDGVVRRDIPLIFEHTRSRFRGVDPLTTGQSKVMAPLGHAHEPHSGGPWIRSRAVRRAEPWMVILSSWPMRSGPGSSPCWAGPSGFSGATRFMPTKKASGGRSRKLMAMVLLSPG